MQSASEELANAEAELEAFADDRTARRVLEPRHHQDALQTRGRSVEQARQRLGELAQARPGVADIESYDELPVQERKRLLGGSIEAVLIERGRKSMPIEDRVTILSCGDGPDDLPRRGRDNGPIRPYTP